MLSSGLRELLLISLNSDNSWPEFLNFVRDIDIFQDTLTGNRNPVSHTRIVMDYYFTVDL